MENRNAHHTGHNLLPRYSRPFDRCCASGRHQTQRDGEQNMAFYMQQPSGSPSGDQLIWPDTGQNILFTEGGPHPTINFPPTSSQPPGVALVNWGGAAQPDTIVKTVSITLDPGFDPAASQH